MIKYLFLLPLVAACTGSRWLSKCCYTDAPGNPINTTHAGDASSKDDVRRFYDSLRLADPWRRKKTDTVVLSFDDGKIDTLFFRP